MNQSAGVRTITTPAITPSGATTQEHMIMLASLNYRTAATAWPATIAATGGTWAVQSSGTQVGNTSTIQSTAAYDADTVANTAFAATTTGNVAGGTTNSVTSAFGFSDDVTAPTNSISLTNVTGNAYLAGSPVTGAAGTVYYNTNAAGSFQIQNAVVDSGSGPAASTFPALIGGTSCSHTAPAAVTLPVGGPYNSGAAPNNFSWTPPPRARQPKQSSAATTRLLRSPRRPRSRS